MKAYSVCMSGNTKIQALPAEQSAIHSNNYIRDKFDIKDNKGD
jgi:hypothetical protein